MHCLRLIKHLPHRHRRSLYLRGWLTRNSSAQLNIAHRSLDELTAYAHSRLEGARKSFKKGLQEAMELQKELADLEKRVRALKEKARERWPVEYYTVRDGMEG